MAAPPPPPWHPAVPRAGPALLALLGGPAPNSPPWQQGAKHGSRWQLLLLPLASPPPGPQERQLNEGRSHRKGRSGMSGFRDSQDERVRPCGDQERNRRGSPCPGPWPVSHRPTDGLPCCVWSAYSGGARVLRAEFRRRHPWDPRLCLP